MQTIVDVLNPVAVAAREGLAGTPKTLPPWLFYDAMGSQLFEEITRLPEYYLTRTERGILAASADEILRTMAGRVTLVELGAGTATKTGLLLAAAARRQGSVLYQPIDVSATALDEARDNLERTIPGVVVRAQVANYITETIRVERPAGEKVLGLYIGSSIGNFSPEQGQEILRNLRAQLRPGDALLLGTDLAPGASKSVATLMAAYDDAAGVTAAFNLNILARLNRDAGTDFAVERFRHMVRWNEAESRMEMHLQSLACQTVTLPADLAGAGTPVEICKGETIHTENSYKFTARHIEGLLAEAGFAPTRTFHDAERLFAVTLAAAV